MARPPSPTQWTQAQWEEEGRSAILDLLTDKFCSPWHEVEARISQGAWKHFRSVQPIQLSGARQRLIDEGLIVNELTRQTPPVSTVRLAEFPEGRKRELERLCGSRRKLYRKYLSWTGEEALCGRVGERVMFNTLTAAAPAADLFVPKQTPGRVDEVAGVPVPIGPLDGLAYIMEGVPPASAAALLIEVKNVHHWIYPWDVQLWEFLEKVVDIVLSTPSLPVFVCVRAAYQTFQMARDIGFFAAHWRTQYFSPTIPQPDFQEILDEFGLVIEQYDGVSDALVGFLTKTLRQTPPSSPPYDELIPWYQRQVDRFRTMAPVIRNFAALAGNLPEDARRRTFNAFRSQARAASTWPYVGGW